MEGRPDFSQCIAAASWRWCLMNNRRKGKGVTYTLTTSNNTWQWRGLNHLSHLVSYNLLSLHKEIYSCNQNIDSGLFNYRSNPKEAITLFHKSLLNWSKDRGGRPGKASLPFTSLPLSNRTAKTKDQNQHYERVINASITREQKCKGLHHNSE